MQLLLRSVRGLERPQAVALAKEIYEDLAKQLAVCGELRIPGVGTLKVGPRGSRVRFSSAARLRLLLEHARGAREELAGEQGSGAGGRSRGQPARGAR